MNAFKKWLKKEVYIPERFGAIKPDFGTVITDLAEKTVVVPFCLREAIAAVKGHEVVPDHKLVPVPEDKAFPVTAARRKTEALQAALMASIGAIFTDGIFVGQYSPTDRDGNSLSKTFNVFAAPEDLPEPMRYNNAVEYISRLKNWHGFEGTNYPTDKEIYAALKDGSYNGGWIIPTRDILHGNDAGGKKTTPDNLYAHKDKFNVAGNPKRAFNTTSNRASGSDYPGWYWSSTEYRRNPSGVWVVLLSDGHDDWFRKDGHRLSCRPVRLVACKAP